MISSGVYIAGLAIILAAAILILSMTCGVQRGFLATFWLPMFLLIPTMLFPQLLTNVLGYGVITLLLLIFCTSLTYTVTGCVVVAHAHHGQQRVRWLIPATALSATPALLIVAWISKG
jgi:hypothetical protein